MGTIEERTINTYDDDGLLNSRLYFRLEEEVESPESLTTYLYDSDGNLMTKSSYKAQYDREIYSRTVYSYENDGRKCMAPIWPDGIIDERYLFLWDDFGNLLTMG